jgi:hypothetical protein
MSGRRRPRHAKPRWEPLRRRVALAFASAALAASLFLGPSPVRPVA